MQLIPKDKPTPPPPPPVDLKGYRCLVQLDMLDVSIDLTEKSQHFNPTQGVIVLLGDGRVDFAAGSGSLEATRYLKWDVAVGDHVLLSEYAVTPFHWEGWEYRICSGTDIVGVYHERVTDPAAMQAEYAAGKLPGEVAEQYTQQGADEAGGSND